VRAKNLIPEKKVLPEPTEIRDLRHREPPLQ